MANSKGWQAIRAKAAELGKPEAYRDDLLFHDFNRLMCPLAPKEFYWAIRDTGTWLWTDNNCAIARYVADDAAEAHTVFHFNGTSLVELRTID